MFAPKCGKKHHLLIAWYTDTQHIIVTLLVPQNPSSTANSDNFLKHSGLIANSISANLLTEVCVNRTDSAAYINRTDSAAYINRTDSAAYKTQAF